MIYRIIVYYSFSSKFQEWVLGSFGIFLPGSWEMVYHDPMGRWEMFTQARGLFLDFLAGTF